MKKKKKKKLNNSGNGLGPWQEHGAMARETVTANKQTKINRDNRKQKQKGWSE